MGALLLLTLRAPDVSLASPRHVWSARKDNKRWHDNHAGQREQLRSLLPADQRSLLDEHVAGAMRLVHPLNMWTADGMCFALRMPFMGGTSFSGRGCAVPDVVLAQVGCPHPSRSTRQQPISHRVLATRLTSFSTPVQACSTCGG